MTESNNQENHTKYECPTKLEEMTPDDQATVKQITDAMVI